eukprot:3576406-Rhodomonas_salina.3
MSKALDAAAMVQVLTDAAQRSGIELPIDDTFWKTATESSSDPIQLKVYAPLSCKGIREVGELLVLMLLTSENFALVALSVAVSADTASKLLGNRDSTMSLRV